MEHLEEASLYYLRSIKRNLEDLMELIPDGPTIGTEVLHDNYDWLSCKIDQLEKENNDGSHEENTRLAGEQAAESEVRDDGGQAGEHGGVRKDHGERSSGCGSPE